MLSWTANLFKKQIIKPPYIDLEVNTWNKDSHALYDYQSQEKNYCTQSFKINRDCRIYRHVTSMKTLIHFPDKQKDPAMENIYIASIVFNKDTKQFKIQSADASGVLPHPYIRQQHPDIFRNSFIVLKDFEKDPGNQGYPLEIGNCIKIGRIQYLVIQVRDNNCYKTLKETSHLELNNSVYKVGQQKNIGSCKICLCDEATSSDPLINPCACKGSCQLVHAGCLRNWINSKLKRQVNGISVSYNFSKFQCQICKTILPKTIQICQGQQMQLITFQKPQRPYIVLQSFNQKHERREQLKERNLHVICPDQKVPVRIGRGQQCQIKITDISVSRVHSQIRYQNGKFYLRDMKSKFGTLIKFREEFVLKDRLMIQYGRTCFDFLLTNEQMTEKQLLQQEIGNRPVFYTRAQLKERGQLSDDDQER